MLDKPPARGRDKPSAGDGSSVERARDAEQASVENVRVDHRRGDVLVTEELLDRADDVARVEQVVSERLAKACGRSPAWE
jgi:hypothetical protein